MQYCKDHAIKNYEIYDDDGFSGTNFDRPGFGRMYEDIQRGLIDTVIVKDQSRFGRSYIDVGMYVEQFKDRGVRFIAVDDCYDSSQGEYDMMFPMRNVINEYYYSLPK
ncbi:MAG: recombinase family protein [Ruminiclostridium sp.]|nr:recombinase family protein [Ruminiclostridium sp.]